MRAWLLLCLMPMAAFGLDWEVEFSAEMRAFTNKALERQARNHPSAYVQPEAFYEWGDSKHRIFGQFFYRYDMRDTKRTHSDIRELNYSYIGDNWELLIGYGKEFWGVAESRHLVDIINQTDLVENTDQEDKLGQPMLKLVYESDIGIFSGFVLPYFRERTFPGFKGRLRSVPVVDNDLSLYESSKEKKHVDWAARWAHTFSVWDVGLSVFHGTSREPRFILGFKAFEPRFVPVYDIISQYSIDVQATIEAWLWKFEGYHRKADTSFEAMVGGFEYTLYGIFDSDKDLGLIAEYHYDSRNQLSPQPFNNDLAVGFRLALNDIANTEFLALALIDRHLSSRSYRFEASRRVKGNLSASLEATIFDNIAPQDPLYSFRQDNYVQVNLIYHFSG